MIGMTQWESGGNGAAPGVGPASGPDAMSPEAAPELERLRERIQDVDRAILVLVAERLRLAQEAGRLKQAAALPLFDPAREAAVVRRAAVYARELGIPDEDARDLCWQLVGVCRRGQAAELGRRHAG